MSLLDKFAQQMAKFKTSVDKAKKWFADNVKKLTGNQIMSADRDRLVSKQKLNKFQTGRMVMYFYDPKYKKELPYYDKFPLAIIVEIKGKGFSALNLHYLPINMRAKFLNGLYTIYKSKHLDEKRKLNLTYKMLKGSTRLRYFGPCYKNYLFKHVRSQFYIIDPEEWDMVLTLPTERFEKKSKEYVWQQSRSKLGLRN